MPKLKETPSQTAGPFVHIGTLPEIAGLPARGAERNKLAGSDTLGQRVRIQGTITDGAGELVKDAMVEIWQADANGQYGSNAFLGFGRAATDFATGQFAFETVKPGPTPFHDGRMQAPHISFAIFARRIDTVAQSSSSDPRYQRCPERVVCAVSH